MITKIPGIFLLAIGIFALLIAEISLPGHRERVLKAKAAGLAKKRADDAEVEKLLEEEN